VDRSLCDPFLPDCRAARSAILVRRGRPIYFDRVGNECCRDYRSRCITSSIPHGEFAALTQRFAVAYATGLGGMADTAQDRQPDVTQQRFVVR
jgi:hypothetical protein